MDNLNTLATLGTDKQSKKYNTEISKDEQYGSKTYSTNWCASYLKSLNFKSYFSFYNLYILRPFSIRCN